MSSIRVLRRLFVHDDWANREALTSLRASGEPPPRALAWIAHVAAAERLWLVRLKEEKTRVVVWPSLTLTECESELTRLRAEWEELLGTLAPETLAREVSYVNSKGEPWTSSVEDILLHVPLHSAYHRGQIAAELRASGREPAYTDFIHAARQHSIE